MSKHPRTDEYRAAFDLPRDEMACFAETLEDELAAVWRAMRSWCGERVDAECHYTPGKLADCVQRWQDCPAVKEAK